MVVHCKVCGKQFASFRGLNGHMNAHLKRLAAEPNVGTTIDDAIMDAYLDEGESYEDAEIYSRQAMNKLKHSAAESQLELCDNCSGSGATIAGCTCGYMDYLKNAEGDEDYWEPYLEALEDLHFVIGSYVDDASDSYRGIVESISLWQNVAKTATSHSLDYVVNKVHKFKMDAYRYIWEQDVNYVWENLSSKTRNLLENFNSENHDYEGEVVYTDSLGWPNLQQLKDTINPWWLQQMENESYGFDLFRSEGQYTPLSGKRRTRGRKQKWIPDAVEYVRQHGKSTAAEIYPALPTYRGSGTPVNAMALSNRLIRMPDIFIVDKSRKPYTYSLVETKEMSLEDDERICFTCGEITSDWDLINEGYECSECSELNRTDYERRKFGVESFEANFNPNQPRNSAGRWVEQVEVSEMIESELAMDFEMDELMALADAIRLQDATFPDVDMLLEQIGDTAENRQIIFDEMMVVMSNLVNQVVAPQEESPSEYYKYILEEPADTEAERIYRQANYYAQFKSNLEINAYLEDLMDQYTIAKEMGAIDDIIDDIEKDINFVELVSRVQNMQREFQAPEWNPVQPRVPSKCKGGKCVKPGECKSCNPTPGTGPSPSPTSSPPTPIKNQNNEETLWVNRIDGSTWTGKNAPNEDWRKVTYIPITENGQQKYIRNLMDDVVKLFPPSAVVYRRKPPLLVITDMKFNINMLANHGFKINDREITYA
jgi:hypothetical protein